MTREEAAHWLYEAGWALGWQDHFWFGSIYDLGRNMHNVMLRFGPKIVELDAALIPAIARKNNNRHPALRAFCLFARRLAREVTEAEAG